MFEDRGSLIMYCALIGFIGAVVFSLMWTLAVLVDGSWVFGEETLSELGGDRPGRIYFNSGVIITGIMGLIFAIGLYVLMDGKFLGRIGAVVAMMGAIALIGVGIFPITTGAYHTFFSYAFFGIILVSLLLLAYPIWKEERLGPLAGLLTISALAVSLAFLFTSSIPLTEAIAVICLLIWMVVISTLILISPHMVAGRSTA